MISLLCRPLWSSDAESLVKESAGSLLVCVRARGRQDIFHVGTSHCGSGGGHGGGVVVVATWRRRRRQ